MDKVLMLNKIKEHLNIKLEKDFANYLGIKPTNLAMWYKRNTYDIELLFNKCEFLNPEWLLTGKGEMLKKNHEKITQLNEPETSYHIENKNMVVAAQQKTIAILEREIEDLRNDKKILHKIIEVKL